MNTPNKVTLVAASIYAISEAPDAKVSKPLWGQLNDEEKKPFNKASEFLCQYTHSAAYEDIKRPALAATFEKQFPDVKANANTVVEVFVNIASSLG
jgi:hypothetical protein